MRRSGILVLEYEPGPYKFSNLLSFRSKRPMHFEEELVLEWKSFQGIMMTNV